MIRSMQIRAFPPDDQPTGPFPIDASGKFEIGANTGKMWGTCCPIPFVWQVPIAPKAREVSVRVDGDSEGWREIPLDQVAQSCTKQGCDIDVGSVRIQRAGVDHPE